MKRNSKVFSGKPQNWYITTFRSQEEGSDQLNKCCQAKPGDDQDTSLALVSKQWVGQSLSARGLRSEQEVRSQRQLTKKCVRKEDCERGSLLLHGGVRLKEVCWVQFLFFIDQEKFLIYNGMVYTGTFHFISLCLITHYSFISVN